MSVRAKFTVSEVTAFANPYKGQGVKDLARIKLACIYDKTIPEDQAFFNATPTGTIEMTVNNPIAIEQLKPGQTFYVDKTIPEDQAFFDATPTGTIEMTVNNPIAIEQLKPGQTFYVDFTPVPAAS